MGGRMEAESQVRAVVRAVAILEQFTLERPECSLTEISTGVGLSKSTTHRLLGTLQAAEMIAFDRQFGKYRLGLRTFRLGSVASKGMELLKQADPLLQKLSDEADESSFLLVSDGTETLCVRRIDGTSPVRVLTLEPGGRAVFNCGSAQRVLLAYLPDERWEEIVANHVQQVTPYSLLSRDELGRDRHEIREGGYSAAWEDVAFHTCAVGAPVRDASGEVVAAVSISGIVQRFSAERLPGLVGLVIRTSGEISRRLGYTY